MAKKKGKRGKKSISLADLVVGGNAIAQMVEPFITAGIVEKVKAGDWAGTVAAFKQGGKEAASIGNLLQTAGPVLGLAIVRRILKAIGRRSPTVLGFRAV